MTRVSSVRVSQTQSYSFLLYRLSTSIDLITRLRITIVTIMTISHMILDTSNEKWRYLSSLNCLNTKDLTLVKAPRDLWELCLIEPLSKEERDPMLDWYCTESIFTSIGLSSL